MQKYTKRCPFKKKMLWFYKHNRKYEHINRRSNNSSVRQTISWTHTRIFLNTVLWSITSIQLKKFCLDVIDHNRTPKLLTCVLHIVCLLEELYDLLILMFIFSIISNMSKWSICIYEICIIYIMHMCVCLYIYMEFHGNCAFEHWLIQL